LKILYRHLGLSGKTKKTDVGFEVFTAMVMSMEYQLLGYNAVRWRRYDPPKRRLTLNGLQGVISQELILLRKPMFVQNDTASPYDGLKSKYCF
jgi:hypothetical protein